MHPDPWSHQLGHGIPRPGWATSARRRLYGGADDGFAGEKRHGGVAIYLGVFFFFKVGPNLVSVSFKTAVREASRGRVGPPKIGFRYGLPLKTAKAGACSLATTEN